MKITEDWSCRELRKDKMGWTAKREFIVKVGPGETPRLDITEGQGHKNFPDLFVDAISDPVPIKGQPDTFSISVFYREIQAALSI